MLLKKKEKPACCATPECRAAPVQPGLADVAPTAAETVSIEFLYLDLAVCSRCQGADATLDSAVAVVSQVLEAAGYRVDVNKIHVDTEELAIRHRFVSSPTIRVNGRDIAMDVMESLCESCGDLCGDTVDCRVWTWQGREYTQPPKAMIIDGILRAVYSQTGQHEASTDEAGGQPFMLPANLKRFYASMQRKARDTRTSQ